MNLKIVCVILIVVVGALAGASEIFFGRFQKFYNPDPNSDLAKATCRTCHSIENGPPIRNPYGSRLEGLINHDNDGTLNGGVTTDDMIYIENEDADGDGYTNLEEIVAGTLPGDPNSHPSSHPTNLPKHQMTRKFSPMYEKASGGLLLVGGLLAVGGKAAKKGYMKKLGGGIGILGVLAIIGTVADWWFLSNKHP